MREGIITLLLSVYFPFEISFVIAALARLYATVADIILALLFMATGKLLPDSKLDEKVVL